MTALKQRLYPYVAPVFGLATARKSRLPWIDYIKGIAIVLVAYRHALNGIGRSGISIPEELGYADMIFFSFRMPLFFILSGLFIGRIMARKSVGNVILDKFENLFYPYLIWSFIQITLQIVMSQYANAERGAADYLYILHHPRKLDQFWYLPALFNTSVIYVLIKKYFKPAGYAQLLLGVVLYFGSVYFRNHSMLSDWMEFYFFFAIGDVGYTFFFSESTQRFLKRPTNFLWVIPIFAIVQRLYIEQSEIYYRDTLLGQVEFLFIALTGCFSVIILSFRLQSLGNFPLLRVIGSHSLYIYLMHVLVMAGAREFLSKVLGIDNVYIGLLVCIGFGIFIPIAVYNLLVKNTILEYLFRFRTNSKKALVPSPSIKSPAGDL